MEKWEELGDVAKRVREDLFLLHRLSAELDLRKRETDSLKRSVRHLDEFRSRAEDFMLQKGIGDTNTFYGERK